MIYTLGSQLSKDVQRQTMQVKSFPSHFIFTHVNPTGTGVCQPAKQNTPGLSTDKKSGKYTQKNSCNNTCILDRDLVCYNLKHDILPLPAVQHYIPLWQPRIMRCTVLWPHQLVYSTLLHLYSLSPYVPARGVCL